MTVVGVLVLVVLALFAAAAAWIGVHTPSRTRYKDQP